MKGEMISVEVGGLTFAAVAKRYSCPQDGRTEHGTRIFIIPPFWGENGCQSMLSLDEFASRLPDMRRENGRLVDDELGISFRILDKGLA